MTATIKTIKTAPTEWIHALLAKLLAEETSAEKLELGENHGVPTLLLGAARTG